MAARDRTHGGSPHERRSVAGPGLPRGRHARPASLPVTVTTKSRLVINGSEADVFGPTRWRIYEGLDGAVWDYRRSAGHRVELLQTPPSQRGIQEITGEAAPRHDRGCRLCVARHDRDLQFLAVSTRAPSGRCRSLAASTTSGPSPQAEWRSRTLHPRSPRGRREPSLRDTRQSRRVRRRGAWPTASGSRRRPYAGRRPRTHLPCARR